MSAAVIVVHSERNARELVELSLRGAFLEVAGFDDPMTALDAIEASSRVRVLITRVAFRSRQTERHCFGAHGPSEAAGH